jgi:hypothetical protein
MLMRTFGPMRMEVVEGCRRLQNGGLHNLHTSPNIIMVNKSWSMKWVGMLHACDR